ncbi:MAG: hypothetical protein IJT94_10915 [Oscillibacter sp.]|nr:hypothetical protein [Oscillibacter sp.]
MTLQQEAMMKISSLPDAHVRCVIALVDEMLKQVKQDSASDAAGNINEKRAAFLEGEEHRRQYPFPAEIDIEKIREEALVEKYGRFD